MRKMRWTLAMLKKAARESTSVRQVISRLGLIPAGGNYQQVKKYLEKHQIDTSHFTGQGWSKGKKRPFIPKRTLDAILVNDSDYQSYKLKNRLYREGIKQPQCEECGWAKHSTDGRIPLELDHTNGNSRDNRIQNLRILCPNCHSLKLTHRGKNIKASN